MIVGGSTSSQVKIARESMKMMLEVSLKNLVHVERLMAVFCRIVIYDGPGRKPIV
jgi:hypothetical protein